MVFSDVSGFTALSERLATRGKLGAEQMTDLLDAVFDRLLGAALELGADLLAFGGDALCLLFDGDAHPRRAAAVAAALQRSLRTRTPAHAAVGRISLGMSIGAHTGPIHLVRAGDAPQYLLAIGPAVSATLALEGAADRGEILVSDTLAARPSTPAASVPRTAAATCSSYHRTRSRPPLPRARVRSPTRSTRP